MPAAADASRWNLQAKEAAVKKLLLMGEDGLPEIVDLTLPRILKFAAATCPLPRTAAGGPVH